MLSYYINNTDGHSSSQNMTKVVVWAFLLYVLVALVKYELKTSDGAIEHNELKYVIS